MDSTGLPSARSTGFTDASFVIGADAGAVMNHSSFPARFFAEKGFVSGRESAESCAKDSGGVKVDMELTVFGLRNS